MSLQRRASIATDITCILCSNFLATVPHTTRQGI